MEAEEVADSVAADAGASGADGSAGSGASGAVSSTSPARPATCPGTVAAGFTDSGAAGLVAAGPASFPARPGPAVPLFSGAEGSVGSGAAGAVSSTTPARPATCPGTVAAGFTDSGAAGLVAAGPSSFPARPGSAVPLFPGAEVSVAAGASTGDCAISGAAQRRAAVSSRIRSRFMVDAYGFRTEPPKRGVPYCKDSPRSTLPMQAKSCSDGCKRLWMSGVLLKKSCDRGRRTCRLRTRPASGRSACLLRRSGIRPPPDGERRGIAARMLRVAAQRREVGYCRPAEGGGLLPPGC